MPLKNRRRLYSISWCILVAITAIFSGCVVTIAQLRENPAQYGSQEIILSGTVQDVFPIPLVQITVYTLKDETGEIPVLSRRVPRKGQHVSSRCKLVYFSGSATVENAREGQNAIVEFLVKNEIMKEERAEELSKRLLQILRNIVGGTELAFFVIEATDME